jgi:hypothetical protein
MQGSHWKTISPGINQAHVKFLQIWMLSLQASKFSSLRGAIIFLYCDYMTYMTISLWHTGNFQNKGNTNIKCQNSLNASWHRFDKGLELYWRDVTPLFHNLGVVNSLRRHCRISHKCWIGLRSGDWDTHTHILNPYAPMRPLLQSHWDLFF